MPEEYNQAVAEHYAAFRPPLHQLILKKLFNTGERFDSGLDIGCGTGYSAIALCDYCDHVTGLDPSESMIQQAVEHPSITYLHGNEDRLSDLASESIDIITFAGSLFYAKSVKLYQALLRILQPKGAILVYDFEILLDKALEQLDLQATSIESDYQFVVDLSDWNQLKPEVSKTEQIELTFSPEELSHLLLADSNIYKRIANHLNQTEPYAHLAEHFQRLSGQHTLNAKLYYSKYVRA